MLLDARAGEETAVFAAAAGKTREAGRSGAWRLLLHVSTQLESRPGAASCCRLGGASWWSWMFSCVFHEAAAALSGLDWLHWLQSNVELLQCAAQRLAGSS